MKNLSLSAVFLLLCTLAFTPSCDFIDMIGGDGFPPSSGHDPELADSLRNEILRLAQQAQSPCDGDDNLDIVRATLSNLIDDLVAITPEQSEFDKLAEVEGPWQQIWSDAAFTNLPGFCYKGDDIYQVVYEDSFYYNISQVDILGVTYTHYIRGEYEVDSNFLPVEFTDNFFAFGGLSAGENLRALGLAAEAGTIPPAPIPPSPFINGSTGTLGNLYVDDVLRVVTDGSSAADSEDIFVLRRVDNVQ